MAKGRPKPLHGAKKYSFISLPCTSVGCENKASDPTSLDREFFVSKASTPAKRFCYACWLKKGTTPKRDRNSAAELIALLGL